MSVHRPVVVRAVGKFAVPLLFVFAVHLVAGGASGPGGGYAAGGAFAAGMLLYGLLAGLDAARRAVPAAALRIGAAGGLVLALGVGAAGFVRGYGFLDFRALAAPGPATMRLGAALIETGIAVSAACSLLLAFYAIAGRVGEIRDDSW